ncbi:hypothetical protein [Mucilaginibacter sp.]|uniref:hypothetical protein n=1 Tax=Mucilaginibacter sp. TaxID=1882438 RepID=UPI00263689D8|nr:hypothetical protein [Mucilaginibacter sp.]MDB4926111.1 hypothetical protein [Mucilaginibacter sp.]
MQIKPKPLLVVAEAATSISIPVKRNIVRVTNLNRIFPAIHELQPCGIVLDYNYMGNEVEKILRRIRSNPFYNNLKIYCYKTSSHTKVDGLLRALGVQEFIYAEDKQPKVSATVKMLSTIFETVSTTKLAEASYN